MNSSLTPILGSYEKNDCKFLLQETKCEFISIEEKEKLIQSGKRHYSELLNKELEPSDDYLNLFFHFTEKYKSKLAQHVFILAEKINHYQEGQITLVSLARAGTPIGVLVKKALEYFFNRNVVHYSISIIRDRGIDTVALDYLIKMKSYTPESIVFIDGWTAKGVITNELKNSILTYNQENGVYIKPLLYVISDTGGVADYFASQEDYPIPSSMLNSTVSGLVSRTLWQEPESQQFHGCYINRHLKDFDYSQWFIVQIASCFEDKEIIIGSKKDNYNIDAIYARKSRQKTMEEFISSMIKKYVIDDINHIKPGIAESTRVILRRVPSLLIVRSIECEKVKHLLMLAKEKKVKVEVDSSLLFEACALIKSVSIEGLE
ncbi:cysteine protease StiP family protein [Vibrio zhanjiangensis]|nr:cysteine protease StiP family protein [Vibrio zhanjiangensis]